MSCPLISQAPAGQLSGGQGLVPPLSRSGGQQCRSVGGPRVAAAAAAAPGSLATALLPSPRGQRAAGAAGAASLALPRGSANKQGRAAPSSKPSQVCSRHISRCCHCARAFASAFTSKAHYDQVALPVVLEWQTTAAWCLSTCVWHMAHLETGRWCLEWCDDDEAGLTHMLCSCCAMCCAPCTSMQPTDMGGLLLTGHLGLPAVALAAAPSSGARQQPSTTAAAAPSKAASRTSQPCSGTVALGKAALNGGDNTARPKSASRGSGAKVACAPLGGKPPRQQVSRGDWCAGSQTP